MNEQFIEIGQIQYNLSENNIQIMHQTEHNKKNKVVNDYIFGDILSQYGDEVGLCHASKNHRQFSIYWIPQKILPNLKENIEVFYNEIVKNQQKIYPKYIDIMRTTNKIYIIFEDIIKPSISNQKPSEIQSFLHGLQKILFNSMYKLEKNQIFLINDPSKQVCFVPKIGNNPHGTSNLYSKFYNKKAIVDLFVETVRPINEYQCRQIMMDNIEDKNLFEKIKDFIIAPSVNKNIFQSKMQHKEKQKVAKSQFIPNKSIMDILDQSMTEYPDIDEVEFQELTAFAKVNQGLKQQATKAFMTTSNRASYQETQNSQAMIQAIEQIKLSVMKQQKQKQFQPKKSVHKSFVDQSKIQGKQSQGMFEIHYEMYCKIFDLFSTTIKSYYKRYPKGFSGILAAYLLCLVGMFKRFKIYGDLSNARDIFEIGPETHHMNYNKYLKEIRSQLAKQKNKFVRLKTIIQNMPVPYRIMQILMPYLEDDISLIDPELTERYCISFMAKLLEIKNKKNYHELLVLQTIQVLINDDYSLVYDAENAPKKWDQLQYENLKTRIRMMRPGMKF